MSQTGKNVRMYRERLKWTQETLAEKVGYSNAGMISQIEDGLKSPSLEKAQDLAVQLGVSLSQLVGDAGACHTVTNNATGDHTVIQNIEGHYCAGHQEALTALHEDMRDLRAVTEEIRRLLRGEGEGPHVRPIRPSGTEEGRG